MWPIHKRMDIPGAQDSPVMVKFPDFSPDISSQNLWSIDPCNSSDTKRNEVISHCNILSQLWQLWSICKTLPGKGLLTCTFYVKNNTRGNWPHATTHFPDFSLTTLNFPDIPDFPREWSPCQEQSWLDSLLSHSYWSWCRTWTWVSHITDYASTNQP